MVLVVMSQMYSHGSESKKSTLMPTSPQHQRMQPRGEIGENMSSDGAFIFSWSDLFLRKQDQHLLCEQTLNPQV